MEVMLTGRGAQTVLVVALLLLAFGSVYPTAAQDEDDSKDIKAEVFIKSRPAKGSRSSARYKAAAKSSDPNSNTPPAGTAFAQLGITIWRFRPATAADKTKELVEEEEGEPTEWTLERMEQGIPFSPGQKVRLSIESLSRDGYLYVINREQYEDGTLGNPILIFPTRKTADANWVKAGRLIYIPSATGKFRIRPSKSAKVQVAELVTIIVTSTPLINKELLGPGSRELSRQQVETWEKQWEVTATRFELDGGAGRAMTEEEQAAGSNSTAVLTQNDPGPQTVYRVAVKPDDAILVRVPLKFTKSY